MSPTATDPRFEALLEFLRDGRGFDFTGYKRSTLVRRVNKRMAELEVGDDYDVYRERLERDPAEFTALFNTILINVTGFFRDPAAWEALARDHLPALLERAGGAPVRVWSAGCASGEETYTLAIVLAEAMGLERFREQVKIYATDVDEEALAQARHAAYPPKALEEMPEELRDRYFEARPGGFSFRPDLRRVVIFGRHDLVRDAPISHLDLLISRNTLMYFNTELQGRIVSRFHFALREGGLLFLGKAEMMRAHGALFTPADLKARIFVKGGRANLRDRLLAMAPPRVEDGRAGRAGARLLLRLRDAALDAAAAAQVVVAPDGTLALANAGARVLFGLGEADLGRPLQDLTLSYRPVELRSRIEQATQERRPIYLPQVELSGADGEPRTFDLHVTPLVDEKQGLIGVAVTFVDVTGSARLQNELREVNQELETAFEELQSTNEELETTNEELQSTVEELETTNEELQSTNEELETMNEELQSTNEEMETVNYELQRRTLELNQVNGYMASILASLRLGVVVLDRDRRVRVWNRQAEELWGLRADEVEGAPFEGLDIGLPVDALRQAVRAAIGGRVRSEELVLDAVNRRGRAIRCRVTVSPFTESDRRVDGAVLVMDDASPALPDPAAGRPG
ncbi:MAG TPA: CheR family methyltransferase [Longimicrobium sp.]|nr:CheR family methyltransferase [Longimicrobium sp.]